MKKLLVLSFSLGSFATAWAALPPYGESIRRINAVLQDAEVMRVMGNSEWVSSISETQSGLYEIKSQRGTQIDVTAECKPVPPSPHPIVGPCPLEIKVVGHR